MAARRQFGKAAAGEKLYIVPEEVAMAKTVNKPVTAADEKPLEVQKSKFQSNIEAWKNFLFR